MILCSPARDSNIMLKESIGIPEETPKISEINTPPTMWKPSALSLLLYFRILKQFSESDSRRIQVFDTKFLIYHQWLSMDIPSIGIT